jgi:hypothetical protein
MKIILSRKGFDSENGGIASPIMEDRRLLSLPIPVTKKQDEKGEKGISYEKLMFNHQPISTIIDELSKWKFNTDLQAHLDPDIVRDRIKTRPPNWKEAFGQVGIAQSHLKNKKVGIDDLFLFFGRFQHIKKDGDRLCYNKSSKEDNDLHVIFGWLQVGDIHIVGEKQPDEWLKDHPHIVNANIQSYQKYNNNTIYIASDRLKLDGLSISGAGVFPCFKKSLQLTNPVQSLMSHWRLPKWFYPSKPEQALSYHKAINHTDKKRWDKDDNYAYLKSVHQGQEFVLNTEYYPEAINWLKSLFEGCC